MKNAYPCRSLAFALVLFALAAPRGYALDFGVRISSVGEHLLPAVNDPDGTSRFGVYAGERRRSSQLLVGADYSRYKKQGTDAFLYSRRLTLSIGLRYDLLPGNKADAMKMMPFAALHYFKSFSKVSADSAVMSPSDVAYYKDLSDDSGVWVSVGAEYYLAPVFSLGCEAGIRYSRASSKAYGYEINVSQYKTFVALLVSFHLK